MTMTTDVLPRIIDTLYGIESDLAPKNYSVLSSFPALMMSFVTA